MLKIAAASSGAPGGPALGNRPWPAEFAFSIYNFKPIKSTGILDKNGRRVRASGIKTTGISKRKPEVGLGKERAEKKFSPAGGAGH